MNRFRNQIENMSIYEVQCMVQAWNNSKSFAEDFNKKRSFIYWDEMEETLREFTSWFGRKEDLDYIISELEQKCHVFEEKSQEEEK